jgi:tetratricopeptide (TPR) repeat protein
MSQAFLPPPPGQSIEEAGLKLQQLTEKLTKVTAKQSSLQSDPKWITTDKSDWTRSYAFWSDWEDAEELRHEKDREEERFRKMVAEQQADFLGHSHDHSEERKFFELPEPEKMSYCERHRIQGNYLFKEGVYPKAAEQYQLALSYYEYCFPDDDFLQKELDDLRRVCLCNISLCFYRMGYWRHAIQAATQVLQEDKNHCKALYRRAQAYRALDEYR